MRVPCLVQCISRCSIAIQPFSKMGSVAFLQTFSNELRIYKPEKQGGRQGGRKWVVDRFKEDPIMGSAVMTHGH